MTKVRHQVKNRTNYRWTFNFCKILWNSVAKRKFLRLGSKFHGPWKTVNPTWVLFPQIKTFDFLWTDRLISDFRFDNFSPDATTVAPNLQWKHGLHIYTVFSKKHPLTFPCISPWKIMGFTVEDRHLIKCLRVSKVYGETSLCKMLLNNEQTIEYWWKKTSKWKKN